MKGFVVHGPLVASLMKDADVSPRANIPGLSLALLDCDIIVSNQ